LFGSLDSIVDKQYALSKKCHMSVSETNRMAFFEMEIFTKLLLRDLEEENKALNK
jgi:hypothetical protein